MKNLTLKEALWALCEETQDELLALCSQLVQRPNVNPPIEPEAITSFIEAYFKEYGIPYEKFEPTPGIPILVATVGEGEEAICINGHTDTVPPGDLSRWNFDPYCGTITETQVLGRGTSDMLCGVAIGMHMARLIAQGRVSLKGKLVLHLVSDEESGGEHGTKWLMEHGYGKGLMGTLLPEPTTWNNFETGSKGGVGYLIKVDGTQVHSSVCSFYHDHAIFKMMDILGRLEEMRTITSVFSPEQIPVVDYSKEVARSILKNDQVGDAIDHVTYNISYVKCGDETRSESEYCEAQMGFGIPVGVDKEYVKEAFAKLVEETGHSGITLEMLRDRAPSYTPADTPMIQVGLEQANYLVGKKVGPVYQWAGSDGRYYRYQGIPAMQYGPANIEGVHGYSECADIYEIMLVIKTYWGMFVDLLGAKREDV